MGKPVNNGPYSVALGSGVARNLRNHLLQHVEQGRRQEDMCFALWRPSTGTTRTTAILTDILTPRNGERDLHGNVGFLPHYLERAFDAALKANAGIAFLHNHFTPGWQGMSSEDIATENYLASRIFAMTGHPLVGLTMGIDGALSARFWPRVARGKYEREWCSTVRVVGDDFGVTFTDQLIPIPDFKEMLKRTYSAWGVEKQNFLARLHCGIVGLGSVGSIVAEALVRMGVKTVSLIDFDRVEEHNLDRLLHATIKDINRLKVEVVAEAIETHATADNIDIRIYPHAVTHEEGLKAALDCDVLFSCVDRPWPRQALNKIAYIHLIPVVDGGVHVGVTSSKKLRSADWCAHVALPGRPCLECLGQFDPAYVAAEREGLLDDSTYIEGLPVDHVLRRNENVFTFAMNAAGMMTSQFLSLVVQPSGFSNVGSQTYRFVTGELEKDRLNSCKSTCLITDQIGCGDDSLYPII